MHTGFELLKNYIPVKTVAKAAKNDNVLILLNRYNEIYYFNSTGMDIWDHINGKNSISQILEYLLKIYEIDSDTLKTDLVYFIRDMQWKELINLREVRK